MAMRSELPARKTACALGAKKAARKSAPKKAGRKALAKKAARKAYGGTQHTANRRITGLLTDVRERSQELTRDIDALLERLS
jgi:hypothetical protein